MPRQSRILSGTGVLYADGLILRGGTPLLWQFDGGYVELDAKGGISHPFRFTGKELDRLSALNMYDFGARWYDVAGVPMWTN